MYRYHTVLAMCLAIVSLLAGSAPTAAQTARTDWVRLAIAPSEAERGTLDFRVAATPGPWSAIRLEIKGGDITITAVRIAYVGGARYTETRIIPLLEGERTRPLDPGPGRTVERVEIDYRRDTPTGRAATIELWAKTADVGTGDTPAVSSDRPAAERSAPATAGEILLATSRVSYRDTSGAFPVGDVGRFSRFRVRVSDNEVFITDARIYLADGDVRTLPLNARVAAGNSSPWIPVASDSFVQRIELTYASRPSFRGRARIELVGELAEGWLGPSGPGRDFNGGWVLLGAQTAGFVGFDRDLVPVGANEGGFRELRVTVRDRAVTLDELRIVYETGGAQVIRVARRIDAGQTFGPTTVDPSRPIREIRARYRSRYFDRKATGWRPAIVEVWGRH